jgi:hypothetical protein
MMWWVVGTLSTVGILAIGVAASAPASCSANLQCRCALSVGGTYNPQTNRWRVDEMQMNSWENCISKGLPAPGAATPAKAKAGPKNSR